MPGRPQLQPRPMPLTRLSPRKSGAQKGAQYRRATGFDQLGFWTAVKGLVARTATLVAAAVRWLVIILLTQGNPGRSGRRGHLISWSVLETLLDAPPSRWWAPR